MLSSTLLAFGSLAAAVSAAPLSLPGTVISVGAGVGLTLKSLNSCLFSDPLTKLRLDPTKVLDLTSNTCLSATACVAIKTNEVVTATVAAGVFTYPVCQKKTCPATLSLSSSGLCVCVSGNIFSDSTKSTCIPTTSCGKLNTISGSGTSAYCKPKTCANTLTLNEDGLCVCASGQIFSNIKKTACIAISNCNTILNDVLGDTCTAKTCEAGQLLHANLGICIDASLCSPVLNTITASVGGSSICKPKTCGSTMTLSQDTGLCVCATDKIFKDAKKATCISVSSCDTKLNNIVGNVCLPKVCLSTELLDANTGLCIDAGVCSATLNTLTGGLCKAKTCSSGQKLNLTTGICELTCAVGQLLNPSKTKCIANSLCNGLLNTVVGGICTPKASCTGGLFQLTAISAPEPMSARTSGAGSISPRSAPARSPPSAHVHSHGDQASQHRLPGQQASSRAPTPGNTPFEKQCARDNLLFLGSYEGQRPPRLTQEQQDTSDRETFGLPEKTPSPSPPPAHVRTRSSSPSSTGASATAYTRRVGKSPSSDSPPLAMASVSSSRLSRAPSKRPPLNRSPSSSSAGSNIYVQQAKDLSPGQGAPDSHGRPLTGLAGNRRRRAKRQRSESSPSASEANTRASSMSPRSSAARKAEEQRFQAQVDQNPALRSLARPYGNAEDVTGAWKAARKDEERLMATKGGRILRNRKL